MSLPTPIPHPGQIDSPAEAGHHYGASFWIGLLVGWSILGYGLWGFWGHAAATHPHRTVWWILGSAVAHDAVVAPVVTIIGLLLIRFLPRGVNGPVAGGVAASGVVLAFSYPLLRHFGRRADNPSILPLDYPRNVALLLVAIWTVVSVVLLVRRGRRRPQANVDALGRIDRGEPAGPPPSA
jgi:hypothetical protein